MANVKSRFNYYEFPECARGESNLCAGFDGDSICSGEVHMDSTGAFDGNSEHPAFAGFVRQWERKNRVAIFAYGAVAA